MKFPRRLKKVNLKGIVERPIIIKGKLENREHICLTVSADHNIVDGAPTSRFVCKLKTLISNGIPLPGKNDLFLNQNAI